MRTFLHEKSSSSASPFLLATRFNHISLASPAHPYPSPTHKRSLDLFFFLFCILYMNGRASDFFLPFCSPRARGSSRQSRSAENTNIRRNPSWKNRLNRIEIYLHQQSLQKNKHLTATALLPKAKYYRTYLEPYLNDVVYIECTKWYIKPDFIDGRPGDRILLLDAILVLAKHHEIQRPIPIPHIWTVVDSEWKHRVHLNSAGKLYLKGFLYLYGHKGVKNIGFQTLYAKALQG